MASPSSRRREGRNAFEPGWTAQEALDLFCPYTDSYDSEDWMDGWNTEQQQYDREQQIKEAEAEAEEHEWISVSCTCPWLDGDLCKATHLPCEKSGCAPYHFKD
jgi:hypothetical protein